MSEAIAAATCRTVSTKLSDTAGGRLFTSLRLGGVISTVRATRVIGGGTRGTIADARLSYPMQASERATIIATIVTTWADDNHRRRYFGVTPSEATASGLPGYRPSGGFKDLSTGITASYRLARVYRSDAVSLSRRCLLSNTDVYIKSQRAYRWRDRRSHRAYRLQPGDFIMTASVRPNEPLKGRRALVTGAGRGIGAGIVEVLIEAGATVTVNSLTSAYLDPLIARLVERHGPRVYGVTGDVTSADRSRIVVAEAQRIMGGIDILVNGLGDAVSGPLVALPSGGSGISDAEVDDVMSINLTGAIHCTRAVAPAMIEARWGRIINISAALGVVRGYAGLAIYSAAKSGLVGFTKSLARELAGFGVTVNAIAPGIFPDAEHMSVEDLQRAQAMFLESIPSGRLGQPRDIGELAAFLSSAAADYLTGQTIVVDGGYSA